LDIVGSWHNS